MNIVAKQINRSNIMFIFKEGTIQLPEPSVMMSLYPKEAGKNAMYSDHPAMSMRIFEFPARNLQWVFEPSRVRIEDKGHRDPDVSKLGPEAHRVLSALYPKASYLQHGFNYDAIYRADNVIPIMDIMKSFLKPAAVDGLKDFGWQYTLADKKHGDSRTFFMKAVSPVEIAVQANFHFAEPGFPEGEELQKEFEKRYDESDSCIRDMTF